MIGSLPGCSKDFGRKDLPTLLTGRSEITRKVTQDEEDAHLIKSMSDIYAEVRVLKSNVFRTSRMRPAPLTFVQLG